MKSFQTSDSNIVKRCQSHFYINLRGALLKNRAEKKIRHKI